MFSGALRNYQRDTGLCRALSSRRLKHTSEAPWRKARLKLFLLVFTERAWSAVAVLADDGKRASPHPPPPQSQQPDCPTLPPPQTTQQMHTEPQAVRSALSPENTQTHQT